MQNCTSGRTWLDKLQKIQHISESPSLSEMFFPPTFQLPILVTSTQNMLSDNQPILSSILVLTLPSTFLLCTLGQLTLFMNRIFLQIYFLLTLSTASLILCLLVANSLSHFRICSSLSSQPRLHYLGSKSRKTLGSNSGRAVQRPCTGSTKYPQSSLHNVFATKKWFAGWRSTRQCMWQRTLSHLTQPNSRFTHFLGQTSTLKRSVLERLEHS